MRIIKQGKIPMLRGVCWYCHTEFEEEVLKCKTTSEERGSLKYHECPTCDVAIPMNPSPGPLNSPTTHQNDDAATTLP